ncbi:MAG: hypothetical protein UY02_C0045G0002 [Candidatus Giovannonibacteria bacterium GW2011_GWB1_47_6b]|uniref:GxxExxY protein n=1 Tax=Candidatus Giovannonibacteria bacterium GW2011_GWB1_47_6b TaxID=1618655 RepID=A0A0G1T1P3_9BACT|nr:MAG: hypothetical protein UY02_C0045G0002 [Candidatus Giovannonibacteria bacterium GW2011_GWB1_47_6b]
MDRRKVADFLYEKESYQIRGACFRVYNELGGGIKENIIERALLKELRDQKLETESQVRINLFYKGEKVGVYIPDIVVEKKIIVELKSKPFITQEDYKQFWGYLKGSFYELGFLVGFTPRGLVIRRFANTKKPISA